MIGVGQKGKNTFRLERRDNKKISLDDASSPLIFREKKICKAYTL